MTWDEKAALHLSVAPPQKVWRLLERFTPERFRRTLAAKGDLPHIPDGLLKQVRETPFQDLYEREVLGDSSRCPMPGATLRPEDLARVPPLVKLGHVLQQLPSPSRDPIYGEYQGDLSCLIRDRVGQCWKFSPEASQLVCRQARFDPELFECFALRAPQAVAEWLLDRLFFGVKAVRSLCEIYPLQSFYPGTRHGLRRRAWPGPKINLDRTAQLAIVLMSLPPEMSAQLFKDLGPDLVRQITLSISRLPPISPEVRAQVIAEVTDLSLQDLESTARTEGNDLSRQLRRFLDGPD